MDGECRIETHKNVEINLTFPRKRSKINIVAETWGISSMDRVADFESVGWGFESLMPHQKYLDGFIPSKYFLCNK